MATEVLEMVDLTQRIAVLKRFIEVIKESYDLNNFFSMLALVSGLNLSPVQRLKKTWAVRRLRSEERSGVRCFGRSLPG